MISSRYAATLLQRVLGSTIGTSVSWYHGEWLREILRAEPLRALSASMTSRADEPLGALLLSLEVGLQPVLLMREHGVECLARCTAQLLLGHTLEAEALLSFDAIVDKANLEVPAGSFRNRTSRSDMGPDKAWNKTREAMIQHPATLTASLRVMRSAVTRKQVRATSRKAMLSTPACSSCSVFGACMPRFYCS